MKRIPLLISALTIVLAAPAAAKGPADATLTGPGLDEGVLLDAQSAMQVMEAGGFWPATYRQTPNPLLPGKPKGDLGSRFRIEYRVLGPTEQTYAIAQEVYPFARGGPVTHVAAGQQLFDHPTTGGWFRAPASLRQTLASYGVRNAARTTSSKGISAAWALAPLAALALAAVPLAARRRREGAATGRRVGR